MNRSSHLGAGVVPSKKRGRVAGLAALVGVWLSLFAVEACSLGEGVTPSCEDELCSDHGACDDGRGGVPAETGCCLRASREVMSVCLPAGGPDDDWRPACDGALASTACDMDRQDAVADLMARRGLGSVDVSNVCTVGIALFDHCMAGGLSLVGTGGGSAGGGGGAAAGGGGSTGGSGGSTGGSGGGTGGTGG
ncbi:MAG: hypothetical protein R3B72_47135 [Polyangiaceae bacterium]